MEVFSALGYGVAVSEVAIDTIVIMPAFFAMQLVVTEDKYETVVPQGLSLNDTPHHTLHLCPPLVVHNLLPVLVTYAVEVSPTVSHLLL